MRPNPKNSEGWIFRRKAVALLSTGIEAACRGYSSGSPMRQGWARRGFGGNWRKAGRPWPGYSNQAQSITSSDDARCGLVCSAQIARTDSRHEPVRQLDENPAAFDALHNAGRPSAATNPGDFVALAEIGRQFRLQPDASSLNFAGYSLQVAVACDRLKHVHNGFHAAGGTHCSLPRNKGGGSLLFSAAVQIKPEDRRRFQAMVELNRS